MPVAHVIIASSARPKVLTGPEPALLCFIIVGSPPPPTAARLGEAPWRFLVGLGAREEAVAAPGRAELKIGAGIPTPFRGLG